MVHDIFIIIAVIAWIIQAISDAGKKARFKTPPARFNQQARPTPPQAQQPVRQQQWSQPPLQQRAPVANPQYPVLQQNQPYPNISDIQQPMTSSPASVLATERDRSDKEYRQLVSGKANKQQVLGGNRGINPNQSIDDLLGASRRDQMFNGMIWAQILSSPRCRRGR